MKNMIKKTALLLTAGLLIGMTVTPVMAEHKDVNGSCYFDGKKIVSDFTSQEIADAVTSLQPGDDVSFIVTYKNNYDASTDWYMENRILQTLEKASASKAVSGTGQAEHGAYTYELIHYDNNNVREVLFSNKEVGGDTVVGGMEGVRYREYEIQLNPGDKLFLYTDGVPEATDANENLFGNERMLEALNTAPDAAPVEVLKNVRQAVDAFVGGAEQFDDLTMLCIEYKGARKE